MSEQEASATICKAYGLGIAIILVMSYFSGEKEAPVMEDEQGKDALFEMNVSAYCPCEKCCGIYADGITASGHKIQTGDKFVAASVRYPFGTIMEIPGYGKVPVLDRGGSITDNRLDLYFDTHQEALDFGRQQLKVKIFYSN